MNISYNWLKEYVNFDLTPDETAAALTSIGLETGGVEEVQTIKGGLEGLVIGVMTMISFLTGYHQDGALLGSTYAFGTLCLARLFHGYNCKSDHPVIFTKRFFNNKWMQGAFALGAILITAVLTIPGLHQVFKVETLNFEQLGTVYLYAFACFPIIQLLKWVRGKLSE